MKKIATVTDVLVKRPRYGDSLLYKPIYSIEVDGREVTVDSANYSNLFQPVKGLSYSILVDPNDYSEFIYEERRFNKGIAADIGGCTILLIGVLALLILW